MTAPEARGFRPGNDAHDDSNVTLRAQLRLALRAAPHRAYRGILGIFSSDLANSDFVPLSSAVFRLIESDTR